jgi:hypothetical protein
MAYAIDRMALSLGFPLTRTEALKTSLCVYCMKDANEDAFRDALSLKEFGISGMCQCCQDDIFSSSKLDTDPRI